ncbi:GNAT family N-acetyltransferase [Sporohalobacter salinus]|uniref:GNAT family N-acetyltransferase n=1 Tax=Sporohalobacter salinus TaxID=1494606 RepID=UPI0019621091|nr:GNAT family N-acetyltransferase [Sporohalobacter salinus]MBM7624249.1 putative GNAT family N-acyltransferase [Sporohalobacter salinus]
MIAKHIKNQSELEICFDIRKKVFVEEQGVPLEDEFDKYENTAEHILGYYNDKPVGTGRMRIVDGIAKLERICILASYRKYGLGKILVQKLEKIAKEKDIVKSKLHGQTHAQQFYEKLGYHKASQVFMEDGIPHLLMVKNLS